MKSVSAVICCCWESKFDVEPIVAEAYSIFENIEWHVLPDVPGGDGWPNAANHMFYESMLRILPCDPVYWMEADCFPLKPNFFAALEYEYQQSKKPYMGVIEPSRWTIAGKYVEKGKHMVGTGIYPSDFLTKCKRIHYLEPNIPWDVYCEEEIVPECHDTPLIHHAWNTAKYRREGEQLVCEDHVTRPGKHSYARPVGRKAAVIHGAKDFSLYRLSS
jgi:hypothetical protein